MKRADEIRNYFADYGIEVGIVDYKIGPTVESYELIRKRGTPSKKIQSKITDISIDMGIANLKLTTDSKGIWLELPREDRQTVCFFDLLHSPEFENSTVELPFILGVDTHGKPIISDLTIAPHTLIGGTTGSGKSNGLNVMLCSLMSKLSPNDIQFLLCDPKAVELTPYNNSPFVLGNALTTPKDSLFGLEWAVEEMERRFKLMENAGVRKLSDYSKTVDNKVPTLVVVIDEMADLLMTSKIEAENAICRLAQKARAAGVYLICCTQRPSADVITTKIRTNLPSRIGYHVSTTADSDIVMGVRRAGAEKLLGRGDGLFRPVGQSQSIRFQGAYITDDEITELVQEFSKKEKTIDIDFTLEKNVVPQGICPELKKKTSDILVRRGHAAITW